MRNVIYLLSFIFCLTSYASPAVHSDFYFVLQPKDLVQLLGQTKNQKVQEKLADLQFEKPFHTTIEGIKLQADYTFKTFFTGREGEPVTFHAEVKNLKFQVASVETSDSIETRQGNLRLITKIEGRCENLNASYSGDGVFLKGIIEMGDTGLRDTPTVDLREVFMEDSWDMEFGGCEGFADYKDQVISAMMEQLNDTELVKKHLSEEIRKSFASSWKQMSAELWLEKVMELPNEGALSFLPDQLVYDDASQSLVLSGEVSCQFPGDHDKQFQAFDVDAGNVAELNSSGLVVSRQFVQGCSDKMHEYGVYKVRFESQKVKSMRDFQKNRFAQFFVFPEIRDFHKSANFLMYTSLHSNPVFKYGKSNSSGQKISTSGTAFMQSFAPRDGAYHSFLDFAIGYSIEGLLKVTEGVLKVTFQSPVMNMNSSWSKDYVARYKPNQWFKQDLIKKEVIKLMKSASFEFKMPNFSVGTLGDLKARNIEALPFGIHFMYSSDKSNTVP